MKFVFEKKIPLAMKIEKKQILSFKQLETKNFSLLFQKAPESSIHCDCVNFVSQTFLQSFSD